MQKSLRALLFCVTVLSASYAQAAYDHHATRYYTDVRKAVQQADTPTVPSAGALRFAALGNAPLAADLTWIWMIQYFGSGVGLGKYPSLGPILERITNLDPKFAYPYQFGMVVLPFTGQAEVAARLGEQAIHQYPDDGLLTYYLATVYHLNLRQYDRAAELYQKAALLPGAPAAATSLAVVATEKAHLSVLADTASARTFWQNELQQARNDMEVDRASRWLVHTEIVDTLQIAGRLYYQRSGTYPTDLSQLVEAKIIPTTPVSPVGRTLRFRTDGSIDDTFEASL